MKQIPLTQGLFALVDDEDYEYLSQWNWFAVRHRKTYYAQRSQFSNGQRETIHMHREIMRTPDDMLCDHKDGNGLNNQRYNPRNCNTEGNQQNRGKNKNNTSGHKGVSWNKGAKKYRVQIKANKGRYHIGYFDNLEDAIRAYKKAANKYHGEYANTN